MALHKIYLPRKRVQVLSALSLLFCLGICGLWVRSSFAGDVLIYSRPGGQFHRLLSVAGVLTWQTAPNCPFAVTGFRRHQFDRGAFYWLPPEITAVDGRRWSSTPYAGEQPLIAERELSVHYGILAFVAALPVLLTVSSTGAKRIRRHRRSAAGRCPSCGYDLRATPGRCPECGEAATSR